MTSAHNITADDTVRVLDALARERVAPDHTRNIGQTHSKHRRLRLLTHLSFEFAAATPAVESLI